MSTTGQVLPLSQKLDHGRSYSTIPHCVPRRNLPPPAGGRRRFQCCTVLLSVVVVVDVWGGGAGCCVDDELSSEVVVVDDVPPAHPAKENSRGDNIESKIAFFMGPNIDRYTVFLSRTVGLIILASSVNIEHPPYAHLKKECAVTMLGKAFSELVGGP
jgi:hypothetical protein